MSKENLARVMKQMQFDRSLQHKQVAAPNADVLNSPKSGELEDRKIKSSPYSLGKLIGWKRHEDTMKSVARRTTLALFGCALVIGAAMPASAGEPRNIKHNPNAREQKFLADWFHGTSGLCEAVNAPLLAAQIYQESGWNPRAVSPAGAQGIAQFKPDTWAKFGKVDANRNGTVSVWDIEDSLVAQAVYMCVLAHEVRNVPADRTTAMLWAYNAGPEATKAANGRPPTAEADHYARRILNELVPQLRP